jgi:urease accessory protein
MSTSLTRLRHWFGSSLPFGVGSVLLGAPLVAHAHTAGQVSSGFGSGFTHPLFGLDHLLAMLAVGVWGAQRGGRSVWTLPVVFPLIMALGGVLGVLGLGLPHVETWIAVSVVALGAAIAAAWNPREWAALALVSAFAIFHGYAHGAELPAAVDPVAYGVGFVTATGMIHLAGIGFGLFVGRAFQGRATRLAGSLIGLVGFYFLIG